jgi:hypothetical protein
VIFPLALLAIAPTFHFQVDAAEFPNAVYHLGCLSNRTPCTKSEVEKFWHTDLHWTADDQHHLDTWTKTLDAIAARQPQPQEIPFLPNTPSYFPEMTAVRRILTAGLDSRSPADFRKRAATLASPTEIAAIAAALQHFERRLRPWWKSQGARYAAALRRPLQAVLDAPGVSAEADRIARFMESEITRREFHIDLIPRNEPKSDAAIATPVGNHLILEVTDAARPKEALPLVMHELTHVLYDLAPLRLHQKLINDFVASSEPQSQALYAILNEGIATGVQIHLLHDSKSGEDEYRDPFIPRIGRAVAPALGQALENGPTLFHGFLETYLQASAAEMKEELASPRFILISAIRITVGNLVEAEQACNTYLKTYWTASFDQRARYPEVNLLVLLPYAHLDAVSDNWPEIIPLSKAHRGYVFSAPRNTKAHWYVLAGQDDATIAELVKRLAAIRTKAPEGLILTTDN